MKDIKYSFYNVIVPVAEKSEYLIYNLISGGLEVLTWEQGAYLESVGQSSLRPGDSELSGQEELLSYLYDKGFFVRSDLNEREEYNKFYSKKKELLYDKDDGSINLTVGTTIMCNMGCPYCFEFVKPNKSLNDIENLRAIITYINDMVEQSPVKRWHSLNVTWYGGEPLINKNAISRLTPMLQELCAKHGMSYSANIITNGILLTSDNWELLKKCDVKNVQITIDGPQKTHDKSRPLKGRNNEKKNYFQILENLCLMPSGMHVTVRINTDREIADSIDELFQDFHVFGLWPMRSNQISFSTAWLRTYEEANESDLSARFSVGDFFDFQQSFRLNLVNRYNRWASQNQREQARLKWVLPEIQDECATWVSPYSLVVDPDGNIHKCWETIHEGKEAISHVSQGFKIESHQPYMDYDRSQLNEICSSCKYLPVCDKLSCSHQALKEGMPDCTPWKTKTEDSLKYQYLLMDSRPDLIIFPGHTSKVNTGHSNK